MSAWTAPKGPLPSRVYWFRRLLVLSTVFVLVFGAARLFGGAGGDDSEPDVRVTTTGAEVTPDDGAATEGAPADETPGGETPGEATGKKGGKQQAPAPEPTPEPTPEPPPLPTPTGPCVNSDVVVTPVVGAPRADGQVDMVLVLRTRSTPACTWQVSAETVTVKISSGNDDYWFSSHCPSALPSTDVVLYQETDTTVPFLWSGRRSDQECSRLTAWALPGYYHVRAAAFEGEPTEVQFQRAAASITATRTAEPEPADQATGKKKQKNKDQKKKARSGGPKPSGAVEPSLRP